MYKKERHHAHTQNVYERAHVSAAETAHNETAQMPANRNHHPALVRNASARTQRKQRIVLVQDKVWTQGRYGAWMSFPGAALPYKGCVLRIKVFAWRVGTADR